MNALKSFFIGPKSENGDLVESLIVDILRDQFYWRKNYHPSDKPYISEFDKSQEDFKKYETKLKQELYNILSELKNGTPFFSPRYIGHMVSETTIPSIVGYFAAMLYNPNNVSSEASPVTTEYELKVGKMLCNMVGYGISDSWGHITSGGTVANLEAMWVSRNIFYLPIAIFNALKELIELKDEFKILKDFELNNKKFMEFSAWELLNINPQITLELTEKIKTFIYKQKMKEQNITHLPKRLINWIDETLDTTIKKNTIQSLGVFKFYEKNKILFQNINLPVILVPQTKHYSYAKIFDLLGLGSSPETLVEIDCDENFRMNTKALDKKIQELTKENIPIISVISVFGTTEEGAIDNHKEVSDLRKRLEKEIGVSFYLHSDAAWGGYIASVIYEDSIIEEIEGIEKYKEVHNFYEYVKKQFPYKSPKKIDHLYSSIKALKEYDSITIDPHKLGYIPYSAGSILFKSSLVKNILSSTAPYVFYEDNTNNFKFIGKYILEGSKPGAAASSCYLSHKVIPLNLEGYGKIILGTFSSASYLYHKFIEYNNEKENHFNIIPISEPDSNIVCFVVNFRNNNDLTKLNEITDKVYKRFSFKNKENNIAQGYDYIVSKTHFDFEHYKGLALSTLLEASLGKNNLINDENKINILRVTCMNALLATEHGVEQLDAFMDTLKAFLDKNYVKISLYSSNQSKEKLCKLLTNIEENLTIKVDLEIKTLDKNNITFQEENLIILDFNEIDFNIFATLKQKTFNKVPIFVLSDNKSLDFIESLEIKGFNYDIDRIVDFDSIETNILKLMLN
ncbi:MAG: pyridoxal-dependent decarboxylase [Candidatus Sericytochromatia bacterium]